MRDFFSLIDFPVINKLAFLTLILTMLLDTGLGLTVQQIWEPLRNLRLIFLSLVANFILVPIFVYLLLLVMPLNEPIKIAFSIMAVAAGPPVLPKLAQLVNGNIAFSAGLMMVMMALTAVYMPIALPLLLQGVQLNPWDIVKPLLSLMLIPLAIGLMIKARYNALAVTIQPLMRQISGKALLLGLATSLVLQFDSLIDLIKTGAFLAIAGFIVVSYTLGYLLGGPHFDTRRTLAVGTAQRNIAAALLTAGSNFDDPSIVSVIVVTSLSMFVFIRLLARQSVAGIEQPEVS
ncbi:MAG: bile acid:sodium symporter [Chroococcidiopsidaceae cyanobacterium CP_BM_ER_R8_30]|nr:bile acid:sodium symporter [Chroococcidiopsidaceae cyanobacterium CP_BM_ER_R8_30]